jgi:1-acyl-sn-glycerol-3-phosphate acyltransferase
VRAGSPLSAELLRRTTDLIMGRVRDQLAELRGETPPAEFYQRPSRELPGDVAGAPGSAA